MIKKEEPKDSGCLSQNESYDLPGKSDFELAVDKLRKTKTRFMLE